MFYSHEILTKAEDGMSTIWVVATIGPRVTGKPRKLSRKAIQDVKIQAACEKILEPGAPIALRLQGNLLYGVSRVFLQQCDYLVDDAEHVRESMKCLFAIMTDSNITDPKAGKLPRVETILPDDPAFNIDDFVMPDFTIDENLNWIIPRSQQFSDKSSQLSPLDVSLGSFSSDDPASRLGINISSSAGGSGFLDFDFGNYSSQKPGIKPILSIEDDLIPIGDVTFEIDAEGNLVEIEQPDLPPLLSSPPGLPTQQPQKSLLEEEGAPKPLDENTEAIVDEFLPDAMQSHPKTHQPEDSVAPYDMPENRVPVQAQLRGRRPRRPLLIDDVCSISRHDVRQWSNEYLERSKKISHEGNKGVSKRCKQNAFLLTFGLGIGNVGDIAVTSGVRSSLASIFTGDGLRVALLGPDNEIDKIGDTTAPQQRRSASEAFGDQDGEERRVRPRMDGPEEGRTKVNEEDGSIIWGDETMPEVGRDAAPGIDEHLSSSVMPWSRHGSVVPGSSVKSHGGSAQRAVHGNRPISASPLMGRGAVAQDLERYSDPVTPLYGTAGPNILLSQRSSTGGVDPDFPVADVDMSESQALRAALDTASKQFLEYAKERLSTRPSNLGLFRGQRVRWIDFEELASPGEHSGAIAAQAFYHVLSLATKNEIGVQQETVGYNSYGKIEIGLPDASTQDNKQEKNELEDIILGGDESPDHGLGIEGVDLYDA